MLTLNIKKRNIIFTGLLIIVIGSTALLADSRKSTNNNSRASRSSRRSIRESGRPAGTNRSRDQLAGGSKVSVEIVRNVDKYRPQVKSRVNRDYRTNNIELSFGSRNRRHSERRVKEYKYIGYDRPSYRYNRQRRVSTGSSFYISYSSPGFSISYGYPYHRRKNMFICLGGYWPVGYGHRRYFWYSHYPVSYNYYTYNYNEVVALPDPERALDPPGQETLADRFFDEGAVAFEAGNFYMASEKFARAADLAPGDVVIPFAHVQALFACEKYEEAAAILRSALLKISPEEQGIYFPRGLYNDETALSDQIDELNEESDFYYGDADLHLLLGYQLFGVNKINRSIAHLNRAAEDPENAVAARILLNFLEKYER